MRGSVRLAALTGLHVVYVWTHDSVGLGEDGPTHQPVEHYAALRAIPNLWFVRPGDANETAAAWALAVERDGRSGRARPDPPEAADPAGHGPARARGRRPRWVRPARGVRTARPQLILIGTGSELQLAFAAAEALEARGHPDARRVAALLGAVRGAGPGLPRRRPAARRPHARVSVEIGVSLGWERWVGDEGAIIGLDHFGASAPAGTIFEHFGFTTERVTDVGAARRPRGPARPDPDVDGGHFGHAPDDPPRRGRASAGPAAPIPVTPERSGPRVERPCHADARVRRGRAIGCAASDG